MPQHLHLVVSPKDLPSSEVLHAWVQRHANQYVISLETGTNGHPHYDVFFELKQDFQTSRLDSLKRSLIKKFPEIPKNELKNIKFTNNKIDDNPLYGYGYALKEGNPLYTTLDEFYQADCLTYYETHCDKVRTSLEKLKTSKITFFSLDQIADGCVKFVRDYYDDKKLDETQNIDWLIREYFKFAKKYILYSVYQKINIEKLSEFVKIQLVDILLDCPPTQPPPTTINTSTTNPLI